MDKPPRTIEEIERIWAYDLDVLERINDGRTLLPKGIRIQRDDTRWWSAETPVGKIGLYAGLSPLLMAMLAAYELQRVQLVDTLQVLSQYTTALEMVVQIPQEGEPLRNARALLERLRGTDA